MISQMMNQNSFLKGAYRGLATTRQAPKLRRILNSKFSERILENPNWQSNLSE